MGWWEAGLPNAAGAAVVGAAAGRESDEIAVSGLQAVGSVGQTVPGVVGAALLGVTAEAAGVTGVVGAWEEEEEEPSLGAVPEEGVAAADWLRELCRRAELGVRSSSALA